MKKNIFLLLSIPCFTACATFQQQQAFDWRGQNFDNYVLTYGVPTSQYTLQNGDNVYSFKTNCPDTNAQEELLITINTDNVIENVSLTAACPYVRPEPVQEIYITKYIETPEPRPMPREKISPKPQPAPKPHKEVKPAPTPAPAPAPAPQKPTQPQVAPKPQPVQDKPAPKPQEQVVSAPQKPTQDKPAQKPQEKLPTFAQNDKRPTEKSDNKEKSNIFSNPIIAKNNTEQKTPSATNNSILTKKAEKTTQSDKKVISFSDAINKPKQESKTAEKSNNTQKETPKAKTKTNTAKILGQK